jgi:hypothetical protein
LTHDDRWPRPAATLPASVFELPQAEATQSHQQEIAGGVSGNRKLVEATRTAVEEKMDDLPVLLGIHQGEAVERRHRGGWRLDTTVAKSGGRYRSLRGGALALPEGCQLGCGQAGNVADQWPSGWRSINSRAANRPNLLNVVL